MTADERRRVLNAARGAQNRAAGMQFEEQIKAACAWYERAGAASIEKTPEPTKQLTKMDGYGRFSACYEKRAQPDFKGTLAGGRSVVFEAKYTSSGKMKDSAVTQEQERALNRHEKLGAVCFVLVAFGLADVYRVPWKVWRTMKEEYGRKYIMKTDVERYRVRWSRGIMRFLESEGV